MSGYPVSDLDPFSAEYFADPYLPRMRCAMLARWCG